MDVKKIKWGSVVEWATAILAVLFMGLLIWTFLRFLTFVEAILEFMK